MVCGMFIFHAQVCDSVQQKSDKHLLIGDKATKHTEEGHGLWEEKLAEFYTNVKYFCEALTNIKQKLPLEDELLGHAQVADPRKR